MTTDQMKAEIARLQAENAKLNAKKNPALSLKITEKGGLSVYGLGRFPVTLYKRQWIKLLDKAAELQQFIADNDALLPDEKAPVVQADDTPKAQAISTILRKTA